MGQNIRDPRLFDVDPLTGITEFFHYDPDTDGFSIEAVQDVEPILEANKALWNSTEAHTRYGEWQRIASLPNVIIMELSKQGILSAAGAVLDQERFRRWLNDRDNLLFRTRAGKV